MTRLNDNPAGASVGHRCSPIADMAFFDQLPSPLRMALASAPGKLAAEPLLEAWNDPSFGPQTDIVSRMAWFLRVLQEDIEDAGGEL